ncbi:hypothetical protein [Rossellomorea marisflavi]|uniref:hypothetical protein n=1 Tax=Rossellomorea marisflavi TaxID=189381 RepID=UPI003FA095F3
MMNKEWIMNVWEQDWDNEEEYVRVRRNGEVLKVNVRTGKLIKRFPNEVAL